MLFGENIPSPVLFHTPVVEAPVTDPFNETTLLFAHTIMVSIEIDTTGGGVILMCMVSVSARQFPLFVEVSTSVAFPAAVSAGEGV